MTDAAALFLVLAGLLHVYIWWLECFAWTAASTRRTFGTTEETAEITRPLAFNQGFYNLFLAVGAFAATGLLVTDHDAVALALACASVGSMLAAALVLVLSDATKARAALIQGTFPALALVLTLLATR